MNSVRIFTTGGTIDSSPTYEPNKKSEFEGTYIPGMLVQARVPSYITLEPLMQKDSSDMTDKDRKLILKRIEGAHESSIVLTHGTDTIVETARFLERKKLKKTIVLVGSFVPFSQEHSDALFNLGYAIAAAQAMSEGVWIAMNGEIFAPNGVRKNKQKQVLEGIT